MRKGTIITTSIIGGVLAVTLVAGASFALGSRIDQNHASAGSSQNGQNGQHGQSQGGSENSMGHGAQPGHGSGQESGNETMGQQETAKSGILTSEQEATLSLMAEEEKVAHDLYVAFGDLYGDKVFDNISRAEGNHLSAVQTLLERYDLRDQTIGQAVGNFSSESMQDLYDTLLAEGTASRDGAFEAARTVEKTDIRDLAAAAEEATAPDVIVVYERLLAASEKHLTAFGG